MHPILFSFGPLTVYSYGLMLAIGFLAATWLVSLQAKQEGMDSNKILDLCFFLLVAAVLASRVPYVLFNWEMFANDPMEIVRFWNGGLVFYGGFIGAVIVFIIFVRRHNLQFWQIADFFGPAIALGHFFGRIGCFFAGCCYGKACHLPWAVRFSDPATLAPANTPLHPTQLYSATYNLMLFFFLFFVMRPRKTFHGQVFWAYVMIYGTLRFCVEFLRGDDRGNFLFALFSPAQITAIGAIITGTVFWMVLKKKQIK